MRGEEPQCHRRQPGPRTDSAHVGSFFALVAHFFDFLTHLKLACIFVTIFGVFFEFWVVLGKVLRRILEGFSTIFGNFLEKRETVWRATKHCVGA